MAQIIPFCSSSKGNSVYIGNKKSGVLIDIGCSFKKLKQFLMLNDIPLSSVKSLLLTHEHSDHISGLFQFTKHTDIPVYASAGTIGYIAANQKAASEVNIYDVGQLRSAPCDYEISFFRTPHDAAESVGYILKSEGGCKIAYCTDLGTVTDEVRDNVLNSDIVFVESNYEPDLLKANPNYHYLLKQRIFSDIGHLSNHDSADFIQTLISAGTRRVIIGHLSVENNRPEIAHDGLVKKLSEGGFMVGYDYTLDVAPMVFEGQAVMI